MKLLSIGFILFTVNLDSFSQPIHQRKDVTMESILSKNAPNQFRAMENNEKYLVVEKMRNIDRRKIHLEEKIYFSRLDKVYFAGNLTRLTDSSLTMIYLDGTSNRYEERMFYFDEISRVYKHAKRKGFRLGLHAATFAPLLYDWFWWRETPIDDPSTLYGVAALAAANTVIANSDKFFRSQKVGRRHRLRVFQYY